MPSFPNSWLLHREPSPADPRHRLSDSRFRVPPSAIRARDPRVGLVSWVMTLCLCAWLAAACGDSPGTGSPEEPFDVVLTGGRVVDGTGAAWFHGDVGIRGDRIARVTPAGVLAEAPTRTRMDVSGHVVAPGFIDIQSHSRTPLLTGDGRLVSKVTQGITTEIMGEGWTNAPANELTLQGSGDIASEEDLELARTFVGQGGFDRWLTTMVGRGSSANVGSYVGASTLRVYGMGMSMGVPAPAELDSMAKALTWAMEDGAFGMASALIYPPGNFAGTEELIHLARTMAPLGGHYITHMRSEADRLLEATEEAIRIGEEGGVPVEIYHLKAAGTRNHSKGSQVIELIQAARDRGLDVQANMYPYTAGGTGLSACLPPWASEGGQLYEQLEEADFRERVRAELVSTEAREWEDLCGLSTPEGVMVLGLELEEHRPWVGLRLSEIAREMEMEWPDAVMELLRRERQRIGTIYFMMSEENVALKMQQPWMKFGTDAGGVDPETATGLAHPRGYGTYPRILGRYVREGGVLELEDAIRKMTSAVATRLSLEGRGLVKEGMYADLVVFHPDSIMDRATFEEPHQLSQGVAHVFVNGEAVIRNGNHTGALPGRALRGPGYRGRDPR
ncbi:MAG: D-aminoacylase [Gemmatimonadota bacterium]